MQVKSINQYQFPNFRVAPRPYLSSSRDASPEIRFGLSPVGVGGGGGGGGVLALLLAAGLSVGGWFGYNAIFGHPSTNTDQAKVQTFHREEDAIERELN